MMRNSQVQSIKNWIPLYCWDVVALQLCEMVSRSAKQKDWNILRNLQAKFDWNISLQAILTQPYDALILTNRSQEILWVNQGFSVMTGYPANFAIGKNPRFLQGDNTTTESKKRIKEKLGLKSIILEDVVNYRKNGEEYICQVQIYPIENRKKTDTYFLALEKEIV